MKPIAVGTSATTETSTDVSHTADAVGNAGVHVVSSPALILMVEMASHQTIMTSFDAGEGSVGIRFELEHVAACKAGTRVTAVTTVTEVDGRRVVFDVVARDGERVLMRGRHQRMVLNLDRFLKMQGIV